MRAGLFFALVPATAVVLAAVQPAAADLIGTQVSGTVSVQGQTTPNFFDPALGFVPSGFGNSAPHGPDNVVISPSITEFGFASDNPINGIAVDFTGTTVTLTWTVTSIDPLSLTFTDTAFLGQPVTLISSSFPAAITESLNGDVLTFATPVVQAPNVTTVTATYSIGAAPAPGPVVGAGVPGLIAACGGLLAWARRRRRADITA
jgi:hypothetical protein